MSPTNSHNTFNPWKVFLFSLLSFIPVCTQAQNDTLKDLNFSVQLIQRAEFRNGYGQLISDGRHPAFFVGQRARINADYRYKNINFHLSAQDIRVWGSAAHTKFTDNFLSVYQAYLETGITSAWKVKLGRQELHYDNVRFLGNLDWALQGRSHDAALLQYKKDSLKLDIGAAYNQTQQSLTDKPFTVSNHYKTAQMIHLENQGASFEWAFLLWNQGLEQQTTNDSGEVVAWNNRFSQTIGIPVIRYKIKNFTLFGFYYHQFGKDAANRNINAFDASAQISWKQALKRESRHFQITLGAEYLSGNNKTSNDATQRAFNPFYGTNHAHNGYMDYFFADGRNNSGLGLFDRFLRLKYQANTKNFWSLNTHSFASTGEFEKAGKTLNKYLGLELDFSTGYIFNDALSLQIGYSQIFASNSMEIVQIEENSEPIQNWAYIMLIFRPHSKSKFVGLLF